MIVLFCIPKNKLKQGQQLRLLSSKYTIRIFRESERKNKKEGDHLLNSTAVLYYNLINELSHLIYHPQLPALYNANTTVPLP